MLTKQAYTLRIANPGIFRIACITVLSTLTECADITDAIMDAVDELPSLKEVNPLMHVLERLDPFQGRGVRLDRHIPQVLTMLTDDECRLYALADFASNADYLLDCRLHLAECEAIEDHLFERRGELATWSNLNEKLAVLAEGTQTVDVLVQALRIRCNNLASSQGELQELMIHAAHAVTANATDRALLVAFVAADILM